MSVLDKFKSVAKNETAILATNGSGSGFDGNTIKGFAVDKAERYGAAFAYGYAKGYYREKFVWRNVGLDLWSGAALTLLSAGLQAASGGQSALAQHAGRVGDSGVQSYLNSIGASWGAKKAGRQVVVMPAGSALPPGAPPAVLGELPQATGGSFLTPEEISKFSAAKV